MPRPPNLRQQRFAAEMKRELSDLLHGIRFELPELEQTLIEVTDVRVTPDLQQVRAYVLVVPSGRQEFVVRYLNQYQRILRHKLAQRIRHRVRVIPQLQFFLDEVELRARRVEEILRQLPPSGSSEASA
ncbi:MAG: ribosome-binding factor A [Bacteroidia bacterium]|nr:ribosome-binding factor A [Bacteroidia bacterium]MDW8089721.1 ribosome-binding factor A [Bacteroidia bacterium]